MELTEEEIKKYMNLALEVMRKSIQERRKDSKPSPNVGAVLVKPDRRIVTAYRGELRQGDHAEYTLLERKCRAEKLDGSILFATLEPCAPGARHYPKLSCSERIVNARLSKVYIGIEDPDPTVSGKGIKYLEESGIQIEMFPSNYQHIIRECNKDFLIAAEDRAKRAITIGIANKDAKGFNWESPAKNCNLEDLDESLLNKLRLNLKIPKEISENKYNKLLSQLGILSLDRDRKEYAPTNFGILMFGKNTNALFPNARVKASYKVGEMKDVSIQDITGALITQPEQIQRWLEEHLDKEIDRFEMVRKEIFRYPTVVLNELIKNAILHRDYNIQGAPIYIYLTDDSLVLKSPGRPVYPLRMEQIQNFSAPSLSRNPKLIYLFDQMGMAEQRGLGFYTVKELPTKYNIPLPIVTYENPYIVFTLPLTYNSKSMGTMINLSDIEKKGYDFILSFGEPLTRAQYETQLNLQKKTAERQLKHMLELNLIKTIGKGRGTKYLPVLQGDK